MLRRPGHRWHRSCPHPAKVLPRCSRCGAAWKHSRSYPLPPAHLPGIVKSSLPCLPHHSSGRLQSAELTARPRRSTDRFHLSCGPLIRTTPLPASDLPPSSPNPRLPPFAGRRLKTKGKYAAGVYFWMRRLGENVV